MVTGESGNHGHFVRVTVQSPDLGVAIIQHQKMEANLVQVPVKILCHVQMENVFVMEFGESGHHGHLV